MKERPILFSSSMVRAILAGTKTQTRRVVKPQPERRHIEQVGSMLGFKKRKGDGFWLWPNAHENVLAECPYGRPGDRLWVRETFMDLRSTGVEHRPDLRGPLQRYAYQAESPPGSHGDEARKNYGLKWKPSIHMPRAASRITLGIVSVRVERLQDISRGDAKSEGCDHCDPCDHVRLSCAAIGCEGPDYRVGFRHLWESINGTGSWEANPWVWVVEFKRLEGGATA